MRKTTGGPLLSGGRRNDAKSMSLKAYPKTMRNRWAWTKAVFGGALTLGVLSSDRGRLRYVHVLVKNCLETDAND